MLAGSGLRRGGAGHGLVLFVHNGQWKHDARCKNGGKEAIRRQKQGRLGAESERKAVVESRAQERVAHFALCSSDGLLEGLEVEESRGSKGLDGGL